MSRHLPQGIACLFMCLCSFGISSCSDNEGSEDPYAFSNLKLQKLDLSDAKYLSLTGAPANTRIGENAEVGLFKIDENGNMSTVVLSCIQEEDGTVKQVRDDIKVIPKELISLSGAYTLLFRCEFKTEEEVYIDMLQFYEPGKEGNFNILVRNSDGKIFYIPQAANKYFEPLWFCISTLDNKGNLYMLPHKSDGNNILLMITLLNDELVIKQVSPNNIAMGGEEIWPLDNQSVVLTGSGSPEYIFLYPNGGFEQTRVFDKGTVHLSKVTSGIKAVQVEERPGNPQSEYIVSLHDYKVGTSVGSNTLSQPIASINSGTDYSTHWGDANYVDWVSKASHGWIESVYETSRFYLLGSCLVVDKQTNQVTGLDSEQSNHVIIPTAENTYKGLAWSVSEQEASWFNIETLEYGAVKFDLSQAGPYQQTDFKANIPSGEAIITGVRNSDGKQVVFIVNIETGKAVYSVNNSDRPITTLIPLN